jgi:hypothetical protein
MLIGTPIVAAAQAPSLNWGSQVNPARCPTDQGYRYLEINVTRKIDDDYALTDALAATGLARPGPCAISTSTSRSGGSA